MILSGNFQELVQEIHRVNKGWHCYETSNRFLDIRDKYLQSYYLKQKNILQKRLELEFRERIIIQNFDEENPSIYIKEEYQFGKNGIFYKNACHKIKEKVEENV